MHRHESAGVPFYNHLSTPNIYTQFTDAVEWIMVNGNEDTFFATFDAEKPQLTLHYLENFFGGHKNKTVAIQQFMIIKQKLKFICIPTRMNKCHFTTFIQKIFGWNYNTITRMTRHFFLMP